jgi:isopenicillin N synthase-like dioxygenase
MSQGLWLPHVRLFRSSSLAWDAHRVRVLDSFLWADDTRGALQVFMPQQFLAVENPGPLAVREEGVEEGIWITADPIPGCIVCNIGESKWV